MRNRICGNMPPLFPRSAACFGESLYPSFHDSENYRISVALSGSSLWYQQLHFILQRAFWSTLLLYSSQTAIFSIFYNVCIYNQCENKNNSALSSGSVYLRDSSSAKRIFIFSFSMSEKSSSEKFGFILYGRFQYFPQSEKRSIKSCDLNSAPCSA